MCGTFKNFFFINVIEVCYVGDPGATAFLNAGKVDFPGQFCTHCSIYLQASKAFWSTSGFNELF